MTSSMYLSKQRLRLEGVSAREVAFTLPSGQDLVMLPHVAWECWPDDIGLSGSHQNSDRRPVPADAVYRVDLRGVYQRQFAENEGVPRLLELYGDVGITTSWVMSGKTVDDFPDLARQVRDRGHETSSQNWIHEIPVMQQPEEERESIARTVAVFRRELGAGPLGWVSPSGRPTPHTTRMLMEHGYIWQGDMINSETPYVLADDEHPDRRLVALAFMVSDYATYGYQSQSPREHYQTLWDSVQYSVALARRTGKPGILAFAVHPFLAQPFRLQPYRELLERVREMPNVWMTTRAECARRVLELDG